MLTVFCEDRSGGRLLHTASVYTKTVKRAHCTPARLTTCLKMHFRAILCNVIHSTFEFDTMRYIVPIKGMNNVYTYKKEIDWCIMAQLPLMYQMSPEWSNKKFF